MRRLVPVLLVVLAAALAAGGASAQCPADAAAGPVREATARLQAVHAEDMDTEVPAAARARLATLKARLADLADAEMGCAGPDARAEDVQADLQRLAGLDSGDEAQGAGYGRGLDFAVRRWPGGRIGIVATVGIQCGSDASLFVFERTPDGWREAIRWQAPPYAQVSGGFEAFDYALSPPGPDGRWFAVAKSVTPWCSSTWAQIRWAILRPGLSPAAPRVLRAATESIWWGGDDTGSVEAGERTAELRWHAESIDTDVHNRPWIRRFVVDEDAARRIAPVAETPRDFADEWIVTPWREAAAWTAPAARRPSAALHDRLRRLHFLSYTSLRACPAGLVQVALEKDGARYFLRVSEGPDYRLVSVARRPDPRCRGPNQLPEPEPQ